MKCPILSELHESKTDLNRALRRIRRGLAFCARCDSYPCTSITTWNQSVIQAIREISAELKAQPPRNNAP